MDHPAVVILAAGHSERMVKPKHLLDFSEQETFLEHIIKVYQRVGVSEIILIVNDTFQLQSIDIDPAVKIIVNSKPELGRFYSIQLGLKEIKNSNVFIQNIDNPFVNAGLLMQLQVGFKEADFVVPVYEGKGGHPILLSSEMLKSLINDFDPKVHFNKVLKSFIRKDIPVSDPYIKVNINTLEDYRKYFMGG